MPFIILLSLFFLTIDPILDYHTIVRKNEYIEYFKENLFAIIAYCILILLALIMRIQPNLIMAWIILIPSLRWIIHDLTLNFLRRSPWDYLGSRSKTDKFLVELSLLSRELGWAVHHLIIKILFLFISLSLSLNIYHL